MPATDPINQDDIERVGATRFGQEIVRAVFELRDGRRVALDLPVAAKPDHGLTDMEQAVLQVVEEMTGAEVLSNADVAKRSGYANSDALRTFTRSLSAAGRLERTGRGWRKVR